MVNFGSIKRRPSLKFIPKGADADSYIITVKSQDKFFVKIYDLEKIKRLNLRVHFESLKVLNKLHKEKNISKISYPILTKENKCISIWELIII